VTFSQFKVELKDLLERLRADKTPFVILGDFNIHVDSPNTNAEAKAFCNILDSFTIIQHVTGPTHSAGHTLDIILTASTDHLVNNIKPLDCGFHGHFPVFCDLNIGAPNSRSRKVTYRKLRNINISEFRTDVSTALLSQLEHINDAGINTNVQHYEDALSSILDKHAPLKSSSVPDRKDVKWYNEDVRLAKQVRRKLERKWRKTRLEIDRQIFRSKSNDVISIINQAKRDYFTNLIQENSADTKALFTVVDSLLGKSRRLILPSGIPESSVADEFGKFFHDKIARITLSFHHTEDTGPIVISHTSNPSGHIWDSFDPVSTNDVIKIIKNSPSKSCRLDPIPTDLLKACVNELAPSVTSIINKSLQSGVCPDAFKKALVIPLIKKANLDQETLGNYRPVSNLSFLSKVLEKVVAVQLKTYMYLHQNGLRHSSLHIEVSTVLKRPCLKSRMTSLHL
jgi:hypothetical protein